MSDLTSIFRVYGIYIIMVVALAGLAVILFESGSSIQLSSGTILADCAPDDPACIPGYGTPSIGETGTKARTASVEDGSEGEISDSGAITETRTKTRAAEHIALDATCPDPDDNWDLADNYTITSDINCTTITVPAGITLTVNNTPALSQITIAAENLTVESGGTISADGAGFNIGPGSGKDQGGGSHGGQGASGRGGNTIYYTVGPTYGSALEPKDLGSGNTLHKGGGAIKIDVQDTLTVDGVISASGINSASYSYGAGSGGSIWIITDKMQGTGLIKANGGNGATHPTNTRIYSGDGSGGRIAAYCNQNTLSISSIEAKTGTVHPSEVGTVALIDVPNNDLYLKGSFDFQDSSAHDLNNITFLDASFRLRGNATVNANNLVFQPAQTILCRENTNKIEFASGLPPSGNSKLVFNISGHWSAKNATFTNCYNIYISEQALLADKTIVSNGNLSINNPDLASLSNVNVSFVSIRLNVTNGTFTLANSNFRLNPEKFISLSSESLVMQNSTITANVNHTFKNLTIDSGSVLSADKIGYASGPGTGQWGYVTQPGAGYGGRGGACYWAPYTYLGGSSYGSSLQPVDLGSGYAYIAGGPYFGGVEQ